MKEVIQQHLIQILIGACAVAGLAVLPAMHVSNAADSKESSSSEIPVLDQELLGEDPPSMQEVLAKHLFVPDREATGQNSFPDLVVKGVYLGTERNALFSLKSRPQANLRIWADSVTDALDQVVDSKDPRQPIVQFLREWNIQKIDFDGVTVKHFITGEEETYAVDYTPVKKVQDDALRGYGQGAMPQGGGGGGTATASAAKQSTSSGQSSQAGPRSAPSGTAAFMADRVSGMVQRMSPQEQQQFMQQLKKTTGGSGGSSGGSSSSKDQKTSSSNKTDKKKK